MATLNKALTRPAAIMGIPLVPFVLVSGAIVLLAVYVSYYLAITAYSCMGGDERQTRKDIHYFSLLWLAFKPVAGFHQYPFWRECPAGKPVR
jgi:type IV secretion system protein VirB4